MVGGCHVTRYALVLTALALLALPAAAGATFPGDNGLIAFENDDLGGIYTIKPNGSERDRLADGFEPSWSPNGKKIVYAADRGIDDTELYTMSPNGKHKHRLTKDNKSEWEPTYSPDGRQIAFRTGRFRGALGTLYVMKADGSHVKKVGKGRNPDWSVPVTGGNDGLIAYSNTEAPDPCAGTEETFTVKPNGKHETLLPFGCVASEMPSWSSDDSTWRSLAMCPRVAPMLRWSTRPTLPTAGRS